MPAPGTIVQRGLNRSVTMKREQRPSKYTLALRSGECRLTPSPHTQWQRRASSSPSIQAGHKATPQRHSSVDPVTLHPSDPPPTQTHSHRPSAINPSWGEESPSLLFLFIQPLLIFTSLKSPSFLSCHLPLHLPLQLTES